MTEKQIIIEARLRTEPEFVHLCLMKLYAQQEEDEQAVQDTMHENGCGFTKGDSKFLSSVAAHDSIEFTKRNITIIRGRMYKYVTQLSKLLNEQECEES